MKNKNKTLQELAHELEQDLKQTDFSFRIDKTSLTNRYNYHNVAEDGLIKEMTEPEHWN